MGDADTAMYAAKFNGKGSAVVFDDLPVCDALVEGVGIGFAAEA